MAYINPNIESSYRANNLGHNLYNIVMSYKPKKILEFGVLYGYSVICMAQALKDLGKGHICGYDLWEKYRYKHTTQGIAQTNINAYGLINYITLKSGNIWEILSGEDFDMIHIDVSNDGKIIERAYNMIKNRIEKGAIMLFEGGTQERDNVEWMQKYDKMPIYPLKKRLNYEIVNSDFPGLSMIRNKEI